MQDHVGLEWTEEEQAKLMTLVDGKTSQGSSEAWRVHSCRLVLAMVLSSDH
jgi:hypothetical protein